MYVVVEEKKMMIIEVRGWSIDKEGCGLIKSWRYFSSDVISLSTYASCNMKVYERKKWKLSQLARPRLDLGCNEKLFFLSFMDNKRPRDPVFLVVREREILWKTKSFCFYFILKENKVLKIIRKRIRFWLASFHANHAHMWVPKLLKIP